MTVTSPPGATAAAPQAAAPRPTRRGYWVGGLLAAAAVVGAATWLVVAFLGYLHQIDGFARMSVPGSTVLRITDTSGRIVYYEHQRGSGTATLGAIGLTVTDPSGTVLPLHRYGTDLRYDIRGSRDHVGRAVATFRPTEPGDYLLRATPSAGVSGTVAIGDNPLWDVARPVVGAVAVLVMGVGAGITLAVVTAVRRSRAG